MNRLTLVGLFLLIVANAFHYSVARHWIPEIDFVEGILYGLCIGAMLLGIRRGASTCHHTPSAVE